MRIRQGAVIGALGIALMGCGVQPTGVVSAGEPASGLTRGIRIYFASAGGLRAAPLLDIGVDGLTAVVKVLFKGPSEADRRDGLSTVLHFDGGYSATGKGARVTVDIDGHYAEVERAQGTGQLVCTLASAQSVFDPKVRADEVEVTLRPSVGSEQGPYRCADFLNG
ncbi:hypothetical protein GCM10010387_57670 [Streptomyces inusitatus]|uniref:Lipoprotein n=1 Tax=Streptomyces inusitatus TaxID=68221 RepID=A0A918V137_9ACTN|nr:GerMN domain-containing protein [Streptomyces inusitatus]GGZ56017.1 hypothetical protein GCM10010387_57670 [Streptomyces inusitatus]